VQQPRPFAEIFPESVHYKTDNNSAGYPTFNQPDRFETMMNPVVSGHMPHNELSGAMMHHRRPYVRMDASSHHMAQQMSYPEPLPDIHDPGPLYTMMKGFQQNLLTAVNSHQRLISEIYQSNHSLARGIDMIMKEISALK
jgi:hypothetical protein